MKSALRWVIFTPLAAVLTVLLFLAMRAMISKEFQPQDKSETATFEINPKVEDITIVTRQTVIDKVERVITPPPPPQIERAKADKPTEKIASIEGSIPTFETPKIDAQSFDIKVSDRDAQPLVRIPPQIPTRFLSGDNSGYCKAEFDVSPQGWKYNPKIVDGRPVARSGVRTTVQFDLVDERGRKLPLPSGF